MNQVQIGNKRIGDQERTFIIAEVGVNHNGNVELAHQLIDSAVRIGADCVKFQTFVTEKLVMTSTPRAKYQIKNAGGETSQYEMLKKLELTYEDFSSLKKHCDETGIIFLSTPYDTDSVDTLVRLDIEAIKIASTDNTNTPFLAYVGGTGKPVIISTGMATLGETEKAINVLKNTASAERIIALHCTTEYPTPLEEVNLKVINTLKTAFDIPVGYSDHTEGIGASPWAVAVGACMIEKHITLDKQLPGPDHKASLDVREFAELINQVRNVEKALGDGIKRITQSELANKKLMQKSIVVKEGIKKGEIITIEKVAIMRPGTGLAPEQIETIIGKTAAMDIPTQTVLMLKHINWE